MPTIAPGDKILVTGANGFLAAHVVDISLKKGYAVRGAVRSLDKGEYLKKLFAKYGDKFELVVVKDITAVRRVLTFLDLSVRALIWMTEIARGVRQRSEWDRRHRPHCFPIPHPRR